MTDPDTAPTKKASLNSVRHAFQSIIWPRRKLLLLGLVLIFVSRMANLVLPISTRYLVDDVIGGEGKLAPLLALVGVAIVIQSATSFLLTRLLSVEAQHLISRLRVSIQKHVLRLPVRTFDNTRSGELVSRIMSDVEGVRNLVGTGLVQLVGGTLTAIVAMVIILRINVTMTLLALVPLLLFGLISAKAFKVLRPTFRKRSKIRAQVTGRLTESLGGIRVIKGFNAERGEEQVFERGVTELFENIRTTMTTTSAITSLASFLMGAASLTIMGYGGTLVMKEALTLGEFVSFTMFLGFLVMPIMQLANIGTQITEAFAGLDRMAELMATEGEDEDPRRTVEMPTIVGDLRFEDVRFSYDEGKEILRGIDFEAPSGSVVALVGSSGSGKSTIAGLAASFMTPTAGAVRVDGVDLSTVKLASFRSQLGLVLQDDFLFDGTIRENVLFAKPDADEEAVTRAVQLAHVQDFTDQFEDKLETVIGERGVKLSGGQKQRVTIARALLANPRLLVLDEATSNLDTESEFLIQKSLSHLMAGRTTLVIAHRLTTIQKADLILVIEDGAIVERGNHEQLLEAKGRYYDLYTYQARI